MSLYGLHTGSMNLIHGDDVMRREKQAIKLQDYFRNPDFWVFAVSVALSPLVLFNIL